MPVHCECYNKGYDAGYSEGYSEGEDDGYNAGYVENRYRGVSIGLGRVFRDYASAHPKEIDTCVALAKEMCSFFLAESRCKANQCPNSRAPVDKFCFRSQCGWRFQ